jgi:hypothetical protein
MITEEQVLQLYNHAGLRTASSAKPRIVNLGAGDQGLIFGDFTRQRYFFVERVWFGYQGALKLVATMDCYVALYVRPNEVNIASADAPLALTPVSDGDRGGFKINGLAIDPYVFARQATFVPNTTAVGLINARLLIWEIEE